MPRPQENIPDASFVRSNIPPHPPDNVSDVSTRKGKCLVYKNRYLMPHYREEISCLVHEQEISDTPSVRKNGWCLVIRRHIVPRRREGISDASITSSLCITHEERYHAAFTRQIPHLILRADAKFTWKRQDFGTIRDTCTGSFASTTLSKYEGSLLFTPPTTEKDKDGMGSHRIGPSILFCCIIRHVISCFTCWVKVPTLPRGSLAGT